ncbi:MAG: redoxin family protein [Actinomycetota bacterium]|nr:redoxin family protein [Actinomycetota bacterium]
MRTTDSLRRSGATYLEQHHKRPTPSALVNLRRRAGATLLLIALAASACSPTFDGPLPDAPTPVSQTEFDGLVAAGAPAVVNVWASWCLPCRSEAPLIATGSLVHPNVEFIGLNVRDSDANARVFMAKYLSDADMVHLSDASGRIPIDLGGGSGVPMTFFYAADGTLAATHRGIIDEPTLARFLDEIDR